MKKLQSMLKECVIKMFEKLCLYIGYIGMYKTYKTTFKNWFLYYLSKNIKVFETLGGPKFCIISKNKSIDNATLLPLVEIYRDKTYTKFFDIYENDVVVDIGAHIGAFSVYAGKKTSKGKVYSFEPCPENFEMLKKKYCIEQFTQYLCFSKWNQRKKRKPKIISLQTQHRS
ncbi:hypothetical protein MSIBF_A260005 [groundwater metagenome]|uniref:Uncharacterized protein n=1 Tax=groundwater metagenome TaxID=717931 RepID=A0A098ECB0_9ZZZZ